MLIYPKSPYNIWYAGKESIPIVSVSLCNFGNKKKRTQSNSVSKTSARILSSRRNERSVDKINDSVRMTPSLTLFNSALNIRIAVYLCRSPHYTNFCSHFCLQLACSRGMLMSVYIGLLGTTIFRSYILL